jgi:hypothetical protein
MDIVASSVLQDPVTASVPLVSNLYTVVETIASIHKASSFKVYWKTADWIF